MAFGIYVHIPYCLQRCRYCDFTTFEWNQIMPPDQYVALLKKELVLRNKWIPYRQVSTIYFGGGTPSLIDPKLILSVVDEIANVGFEIRPDTEITIEINPATVSEQRLNDYIQGGVNRYSVGAQTFSDHLLQLCGRKHSAQDTRETLALLRRHGLNYSFDLLFALPGQTLKDLDADLSETLTFDPPHLSAYCLTVPEGHPMSTGRAPDQEQVAMFQQIESRLEQAGTHKYEISNFSKPGFESKHNSIYWTDQAYWGLGLSAHSYLPELDNGFRFWNPKNLDIYQEQVTSLEDLSLWPSTQGESLKINELATDFCHTHLRTMRGLPKDALRYRVGDKLYDLVASRLEELQARGWIDGQTSHWKLTNEGQMLSNRVFSELTFLPQEFH